MYLLKEETVKDLQQEVTTIDLQQGKMVIDLQQEVMVIALQPTTNRNRSTTGSWSSNLFQDLYCIDYDN